MPYTTVVAGTTITASWANTNVRDQAISTFASEAARNTAIPTPTDGLFAYTQDTNRLWRHDGSNWVFMGGASVRAEVRRTSTQSIPTNVATAVLHNSVSVDSNTLYSAGQPSRLTVPAGFAGLYTINFYVQFGAAVTGVRQAFLVFNSAGTGSGTRYAQSFLHNNTSAQGVGLNGTTTVQLGPGDYVELFVYHESGAALNIYPNASSNDGMLSMYWVAPAG